MFPLLAILALSPAPADLVIENAKIWTDGRPGFARFAAVSNGRFTYIGETEKNLIGPNTVHVDANGRVVLPGLIDSHTHMIGGGMALSEIQLRDAKDKSEFVARVADRSSKLAPGKWLTGGRWSVDSWADKSTPSKEWIDAATAGHPAYLGRMDGHSGLANSAALKLAGITKDGPKDPPGGVIDRDPNGEPTGILRETAQGLVTRLIPSSTPDDVLEALKAAMAEANRRGVTSVSDVVPIYSLDVYERLAKWGSQTVRFALYPVGAAKTVADLGKTFSTRSGWMQIRGFKAYMDGSLGSRTAYMHEPFSDNPPDKKDWRGLPMPGMLTGAFEAQCVQAKDAGLQTICHAIGDEGNDQLLNILDKAYGPALAKARCRSEHAQHLLPGDIKRFASLGVIASMQPFHKADDARYAEARIGPERSKSSYAFKSLLKAGATVAFGSDWPVVTINPFVGIEAAVTGRTLDGKLWQTQENISVEEALRCYTSRGAYAMFMENEIGKIAPGFRADFIVLNASPFERNAKWSEIKPVEVWVEGKKVL